MSRPAKLIAAAVLAPPLLAMSADSHGLEPGRWVETTTTVSAVMDGKPLPEDQVGGGDRVSSVCIASTDAADPETYFKSSTPSGKCGVPTGTVGDGRIALASTCTNEGQPPALVELNGTYQQRSYSADVRATIQGDGREIVVTMKLTGTHEGACRGDEDMTAAGPDDAG